MERTLQIQSPYGKGMTIKTLQGNEGISQLYEFKLTLTSKDPNRDCKIFCVNLIIKHKFTQEHLT